MPSITSSYRFPGPLQGGLFGPYLKFVDVDYDAGYYRNSVLMIQKKGIPEPVLYWRIRATGTTSQPSGSLALKPIQLDPDLFDYQAFRFDLMIAIAHEEQLIEYSINTPPEQQPAYCFAVPARGQPLRWMYNSCSGFSLGVNPDDLGGFHPLWEDFLRRHREKPMHAIIGGGDQIYMDSMWEGVRELKDWLAIKGRKNRTAMAFPDKARDEVSKYYIESYLEHFAKRGMAEALASVPSINVIDDHDIWDGFGSYPEYLQRCPYFQGIAAVARRMYLLFQHHETAELARRPEEGYFGEQGFNFLRRLGPQVTMLGTDTRFERSKQQIVNPGTYRQIFERLRCLPDTVRHLIVVLAVPIVYPHMTTSHNIQAGLSNVINNSAIMRKVTGMMQKTGAFKAVVNQFGEPELLDDLVDHWDAPEHREERRTLIESFQRFAADKSIRVTFLGGDVHCGGMGHLCTKGNSVPATQDHREMLQVIASAIVNVPPPAMLISVLHQDKAVRELNEDTHIMMHNLFKVDVDKSPLDLQKLIRRRNYAVVQETAEGVLEVSLRVESKDVDQDSVPYAVSVLPLRCPKAAA